MSKILGILGGSGTLAGVRMVNQLVGLSVKSGANSDRDFPKFLYYNCTDIGMDEAGESDNGLELFNLMHAVRMISRSGCHYLLIACNTLYRFIDQLDGKNPIEIINLPRIAMGKVTDSKVGILCSRKCRDEGVFSRYTNGGRIKIVETNDDEQDTIDRVILAAIGGKTVDETSRALKAVIASVRKRGAGQVILGCTELPLAMKSMEPGCIDAGAEAVEFAYGLL